MAPKNNQPNLMSGAIGAIQVQISLNVMDKNIAWEVRPVEAQIIEGFFARWRIVKKTARLVLKIAHPKHWNVAQGTTNKKILRGAIDSLRIQAA